MQFIQFVFSTTCLFTHGHNMMWQVGIQVTPLSNLSVTATITHSSMLRFRDTLNQQGLSYRPGAAPKLANGRRMRWPTPTRVLPLPLAQSQLRSDLQRDDSSDTDSGMLR